VELFIVFLQTFYPVNYLRNTAITQAPTDFLFIIDVDFVPMPHTYQILHTYIGSGIPKKNEVAEELHFDLNITFYIIIIFRIFSYHKLYYLDITKQNKLLNYDRF